MREPQALHGKSTQKRLVGQAVQRACRAIGPVGIVPFTLTLVWVAAVAFFLCSE